MGIFDQGKVEVPCPNCGHKSKKTVSRLELKPQFTCDNCGQGFDASGFNRSMKQVDKGIADLQRTIRQANRRLSRKF